MATRFRLIFACTCVAAFLVGIPVGSAQANTINTGGVDLLEVLDIQKLCFKATEGDVVDIDTFLVRGWAVSIDDGKGRKRLKHPDRKSRVMIASTDHESCVVLAPARASQATKAYLDRFPDLAWQATDDGGHVTVQPHRVIGVKFTSGVLPTLRVHTIIRKNQSK